MRCSQNYRVSSEAVQNSLFLSWTAVFWTKFCCCFQHWSGCFEVVTFSSLQFKTGGGCVSHLVFYLWGSTLYIFPQPQQSWMASWLGIPRSQGGGLGGGLSPALWLMFPNAVKSVWTDVSRWLWSSSMRQASEVQDSADVNLVVWWGWSRWHFRVPSNPSSSVILHLCWHCWCAGVRQRGLLRVSHLPSCL